MTKQKKALNRAEKEWLAQMQALALKAPARFSSYTIGDNNIEIYDNNFEDEINALLDSGGANDFGPAVEQCEASLGTILFPGSFSVHSTAG